MSEVVAGCRLDYFSRNLIERAVDQSAAGTQPVRVVIEHNGKKYRVLVSALLDKQEVLESRSAASPIT